MKLKERPSFDYGAYIVEYREKKDGPLKLLRKRMTDLDQVLLEANRLKDAGNHDVLIRLHSCVTT
jgi:hypothetical protein